MTSVRAYQCRAGRSRKKLICLRRRNAEYVRGMSALDKLPELVYFAIQSELR